MGALGSWTKANEGYNVVTMVKLADGKEAGNGAGVGCWDEAQYLELKRKRCVNTEPP